MVEISSLSKMAFKTIKKRMKQDTDFSSMVQQNPEYKNIFQTVQSNLQYETEKKMLEREHQFNFLLFRYIHLRLVYSILVLLEYEPDSYIELSFPYKHSKMEIFTERDEKNNIIYSIEFFQSNDQPLYKIAVWDKNHFAKNLINMFIKKFPRKVNVWRSSVSMTDASTHSFVHNIENTFNEKEVPKQLVKIYNQQYKEMLFQ